MNILIIKLCFINKNTCTVLTFSAENGIIKLYANANSHLNSYRKEAKTMKKKMLLGMIFTVFMVLLIGSSASAAEEMTDGTWTYAEYGTDVIEIVGYSGTQTDVYIPSQIDGKQVVRVGNGAFKDMTGLNSVTFSANIKELGDNAFEGATGLVCVLLNEGLETIGNDVFDGCTNFNSIILYDSIVSIGDTIFTGCSEATVYYIEGTAGETYALNALNAGEIYGAVLISEDNAPVYATKNNIEFYIANGEAAAKNKLSNTMESILIPATVNGYPVTRIEDDCFNFGSQHYIKAWSIPNTIRKIGVNSFEGCWFSDGKAGKFVLPEGLKEIPSYAFAETYAVSFVLPDSVETIADRAFYNTRANLIELSETSNLKTIGNYAFAADVTSQFYRIYIPESVESIGDFAFGGKWIDDIIIANKDIKLGNKLFARTSTWTRVSRLYVPNGLVNSSADVWYDCGSVPGVFVDSLEAWLANPFVPSDSSNDTFGLFCLNEEGTYTAIDEIPEGITDLNGAFNNVSNITTLKLPSTLTTLGKGDLLCYSITALEFSPKTLTKIESGAISEYISTYYIDDFDSYLAVIRSYAQNPIRSAKQIFVKNENGEYEQLTTLRIPDSYGAIPSTYFSGYSDKIPATWFDTVYIGKNISVVNATAFQYCTALANIHIDVNETSLEFSTDAFLGCSAINSVYIDDLNKWSNNVKIAADYDASPILNATNVYFDEILTTSVTIPAKEAIQRLVFSGAWVKEILFEESDSYRTIESYCFGKSANVETITLPVGITSIGAYAFDGCSSLKEIIIPETVSEIPDYMLYGCASLTHIGIPDSITKLGIYAFGDCTALETVTVGSNSVLSTVADNCFRGCVSLAEISFPETISTLGKAIFYDCASLKSFVFPSRVTVVPENMFYQSGLENVTLNENITLIRNLAFSGTQLTSIDLKNTKSLMNGVFSYTPLTAIDLSKCSLTGTSTFEQCTELTEIDLSNQDHIYDSTFAGCSKLERVNFGNKLTGIGDSAFRNCISLTEVILPDTVTKFDDDNYSSGSKGRIFAGCTSLKYVKLSNNLTRISSHCFDECPIERIIIPASVQSIQDYAFYKCTELEEIQILGKTTSIGSQCFTSAATDFTAYIYKDSPAHVYLTNNPREYTIKFIASLDIFNFEENEETSTATLVSCIPSAIGEVTVPATSPNGYSVTAISNKAFYNCSSVTKINLPDTIQKIGDNAFDLCAKLTDMNIPTSLKHIGNEVFKNSKIKDITLPDGIEYVGDYAFYCSELKSINLSENAQYIGQAAFSESDITEITIPESITALPNNLFTNCAYLTSVTLHDNITDIGHDAFRSCINLTDITLPASLTVIDENLFRGCLSLNSITVPNSVTEIKNNAFSESGLTSIVIPNTVTTMGEYIFSSCTNLKTVTLSNAVTALPDSTFLACTNLSKLIGIENYTEYGNSCFLGCVNVQPLEVLHSKLEVIGEKAFNGAFKESSTGITLPESIRTVGSQAFSYCTSIVKVRIPAALKAESTTIATDAFLHSPEAILWVYKDSFGYSYALEADRLYFIIKSTANPEIDYGCAISGYVRYNDGSPAANVDVQLIYDDGTVSQTEKTDSNGQYVFSFAEVGAYKLRASDSADNIDTTSVSIKRKNVFSVILTGQTNLTLRKGWRVSGTATATGGVSETNPITVTMTDDKGDVIGVKTITTADGEFVFTNINNGEYRLVAENNNGLAHTEVIVHNKNHSGTALVIDDLIPDDGPAPEGFASIVGNVYIEDRIDENFPDKTPDRHRRDWVKLTLYDADGNILKHTKSAINSIENEYDYIFRNLPMGEYTIVAEVTLMRPHHHKNHENDPRFRGRKCDYHQPFDLKGYAYVEVTEAKQYIADDIILAEENDNLSSIKGKVTAQGSPQTSTVILEDVFHHEIATFKTKNNGKFEFSNIKDGLYLLTAVTDYDGVGFAVVYLRNGKLHTKFFDEDSKLNGKDEIHIKVGKNEKIHDYEMWFKNDGRFHGCTKDNVHEFKKDIEEMKSFYDGLSDRDKKGFAPEYLSRFWEMIEWLNCSDKKIDTDSSGFSDKEKGKVAVDNIGSIIPSDDIGEGKSYTVTVKVDRLTEEELQNFDISVTEQEDDDIEITTDEQYYQSTLEESAKNQGKQLGKKKKDKDGNETEEIEYFYYNIELSFSKDNGTAIEVSDIAKDTDTNGKLRLTLPIPEDFLDDDYTSYSLLHIHNGEITTLTDLDDDPMTITVEVDKFSVFAFARSNVEQIASYTVTWKNEDGTILETDTDVTYGTTPEYNSAIPEKEKTNNLYYVFTGWTPEIADVTEDAVYTAVFEQRTDSGETVTVTFKAGDKQFTKSVVSGSAFRLPVLTEDELNAAFVPERDGEPISAYTFFWKVTPGDASLAAFTEQDGYYLPDAEYTASADMKFEAAWIYTDAELVLLPNADKAIAANHEFAFDIYLSSADIESVTELESGEFTVGITTIGNKKYDYELIPNNGITFNRDNGNTILFKRKDGDTPYLVPENVNGSYRILLGTVKVTGAGQGNVALTSPKAYRHIVEGADKDNNAFEVYVREVSADYTVDIPTADLEITIDFKNAVCDNTHEYQNMTLTVSGGDLTKDIIVRLGNDSPVPDVDEPYKNGENVTANAMADNKYVVKLESVLSLNKTYNVSVKGEGYRTARYSINMTKDKCLYFWNNVMDIPAAIEKDNPDSEKATSFLAGDIVKDNEINIYDLSAVVSYFGEEGITVTKHPEYIKYDLNRDGKINSLDVAYVLVSWGK